MSDDISRNIPDPTTTVTGGSPVAPSATPEVTSPPGASGEAGSAGTPTAERAKGEAKNVASQAADSGGQVLDTAKGEASEVISHAGQSARTLFEQVRGELTDQAGTQQQRVAGGLHDLADELDRMGGSSEQSGLASSLVKQASDRARSTAEWMSGHEPGDLVTEAQRFAARRPGTFLAAAAVLGFLGARLTRGLTADAGSDSPRSDDGPSRRPATRAGYGGRSGLSPATTSGASFMVDDDDDLAVPTVTTSSHGELVTYPSAGSPAGPLTTTAASSSGDPFGLGTGDAGDADEDRP